MSKKTYIITKVIVVIVVCLVVGYASWLSLQKVGDVYLDETERAISEIKQNFLKTTVENIIREIDVTRELEANFYERIVDRRYETLSYEAHLSDNEFADYFINRFRGDADRQTGPDYWTALLWNAQGEILYDPSEVFRDDLPTTLGILKDDLHHFRTITHGEIRGLWGVRADLIELLTKEKITEKIRNLQFDGGSYIWINWVLDYNGGDNYAIRVIHPNLPETEGMYLSTETTDQHGNRPYLEELEGVKEYGELFFRYWFKKLGSEESSEKLTYAKLYTDYDWIIAMGIHIDDMQKYIAQTSAESEKVAFMLSLRLVFLLMGLVVAALGLVFMLEQFHLKATTTRLRYEMNKDPVTGVCSRRCGTNKLTASFEEFQITGLSPAIVLFDFDRFKAINDTYGHTVGDQVLKSVVDAVQRSIRVADEVIRWGGDEFVVILEGLEKGNVAAFCNKILKTVSSLEVVVADEVIRPSVSLGASYFHASDETFLDALRRADRAMYRGKQAGRNKVEVLL